MPSLWVSAINVPACVCVCVCCGPWVIDHRQPLVNTQCRGRSAKENRKLTSSRSCRDFFFDGCDKRNGREKAHKNRHCKTRTTETFKTKHTYNNTQYIGYHHAPVFFFFSSFLVDVRDDRYGTKVMTSFSDTSLILFRWLFLLFFFQFHLFEEIIFATWRSLNC